MKTIQQILDKLEELKNDPRLNYQPVQVNAPLALIQLALIQADIRAQINTLRWVLRRAEKHYRTAEEKVK